MSQPTRSDVHVNRPLTNISIAYIQNSADFIADKVFPVVPVAKQADRYFVYDKDYWFRTQAEKRGPGSESAGSGFHVDNTPSYFADVYAHHMDVSDQVRTNADDPLNMDRDATMFVTQNLILKREKIFMGRYMKTGVWTGAGGDFTPAVKWDASGSNPMLDIDLLKASIKASTGFLPNTLVVSNDVFFALRNNAVVLDRIKYTQRGIITEELLAALFGVQKFLVASAVLNSAQEGVAGSYNYLTNKSFLLTYSNAAPSILQPSAGYVFSWQGLFGAGAQGNRIKTFRMEHLESDRIEGEMSFDMKLVGADLGVYGNAVIS
jgi:hypothetical protein